MKSFLNVIILRDSVLGQVVRYVTCSSKGLWLRPTIIATVFVWFFWLSCSVAIPDEVPRLDANKTEISELEGDYHGVLHYAKGDNLLDSRPAVVDFSIRKNRATLKTVGGLEERTWKFRPLDNGWITDDGVILVLIKVPLRHELVAGKLTRHGKSGAEAVAIFYVIEAATK